MAMDKPQPLIFAAWIDRFYIAVMQRAGLPRQKHASRRLRRSSSLPRCYRAGRIGAAATAPACCTRR